MPLVGDVGLHGEIGRQAGHVGRQGHSLRGHGQLPDALAGPQLRRSAPHLPVRRRLVPRHVREVVVQDDLVPGDKIGLDGDQVGLATRWGRRRRARRNRLGGGRSGLGRLGRVRRQAGQVRTALGLGQERDLAAGGESQTRSVRGQIDRHDGLGRAGCGADGGTLLPPEQPTDGPAGPGDAGRLRSAAAPANGVAVLVDIEFTLGIGDRLDLRCDGDCLAGMSQGFEVELQDRFAAALLDIDDLALHDIALEGGRVEHPGRDEVALVAGSGPYTVHQFHLDLRILGLDGRDKEQR